MDTTAIDIRPFQKARQVASDLSALLNISAELNDFQATAANIADAVRVQGLAQRLKELDAASIEHIKETMDGLSLNLAALRMNVRSASWLFRLVYFFNIRRFHKSAAKIIEAADLVRANLPDRLPPPTQTELDADAALLSRLKTEDSDWVSFDEVLQEDHRRWRTSK
jgi:hypothetical protein